MTNSGYIAHTTPLLIKHGLLNVRDMYKLKLLKFYYKLAYDLLPPYFNYYTEVIERKPVRILRHHYIHAPLIKRVLCRMQPSISTNKINQLLKK